ncbi:MAG: hypothetical protein ABFS14_03730 [Gemmatimonadota bacterium]
MKTPQRALLPAVIAMTLAAACSDTPVQPETDGITGSSFAIVLKTTADVHPFSDFSVDLGDSRINRTTNGINPQLETSGLTPGSTYTLWAVIFNDGDATNDGGAFDAVRFVDGVVANESGRATFSGRVNAHDGGGELFGELTDPTGAEVHLVVRCHGPRDPEFMPDQINSFAGGCTPESSFGIGDGPYECLDVQVAIHPSGS